ncbi:MAG: multicopper oxidase domain-containing protein, partial [Candidatus Acidiferrales bacterium]
MNSSRISRRKFLTQTGALASASLASSVLPLPKLGFEKPVSAAFETRRQAPPNYTLRIANTPVEIAPGRILSATTYNGQFPGPLLRFKEGREATVDIFNDTDAPEQLHWHGQKIPADVDGAAEEGTPYIPAHGSRRITFTPNPAGLRFYHTHIRDCANLAAVMYSGELGPVYFEPAH